MELLRIADDLEQHVWYGELVDRTVAEVEAFAARWAAFEELVGSLGEPTTDD